MKNLINIFGVVFFCCALCQSTDVSAQNVVKCEHADTKEFAEFLKKFEENIIFQQTRILLPLVVREGDYTMSTFTVSKWGIGKIKSLETPLILSKRERAEKNISEDILLNTKRYVEVFHDGPPESDVYRMLYKFRFVDGCWFLEELHDKSL